MANEADPEEPNQARGNIGAHQPDQIVRAALYLKRFALGERKPADVPERKRPQAQKDQHGQGDEKNADISRFSGKVGRGASGLSDFLAGLEKRRMDAI